MRRSSTTEALLRARFGPEVLINQIGTIWLVHLDQPNEVEIQEHVAEVQRDVPEPEDCACCELMRPQTGDTLILPELPLRCTGLPSHQSLSEDREHHE